jgi:hypothetical protein
MTSILANIEEGDYKWPKGEKLVFVRPPVEEYNGNHKNFYHPDQFKELNILKENWIEIRNEIINYEKNIGFKGASFKSSPDVTGSEWNVIYLKSFNLDYHKNKKKFPFLISLIDKIPNSVFAAISVIPPNTTIEPHYGDTNGIVRCHLGIIIPESYPKIGIRVGNEEMGWEEGKIISFINVQEHSVWNKSDKKRYIVMIDIVPQPISHLINKICVKGLASQSFIILYRKLWIVRKLPNIAHKFLIFNFELFWRIYLPFHKFVKFII